MLQSPAQILPPLRSHPDFPGGCRAEFRLPAQWIWGLQVLRVRGRPSWKGSRVVQRITSSKQQVPRAGSVGTGAHGCGGEGWVPFLLDQVHPANKVMLPAGQEPGFGLWGVSGGGGRWCTCQERPLLTHPSESRVDGTHANTCSAGAEACTCEDV